jgi:ectoine hydroxylase-related dioxygenase (phytanoyl-CoA dioxygenase family)
VLRNSNIRVTQPGSGDATIWHTDYRPHTTPAPRLPSAPTVITILLYLDPADGETGPLFVVPGSHLRAEQPSPEADTVDGQVALKVEPGQIVVMNGALWHRGGPNHSDRIRRLITLQLSTIFMTEFNFEPSMPSPAFQRLLETSRTRRDEPLLELLGLRGVNPTSASY